MQRQQPGSQVPPVTSVTRICEDNAQEEVGLNIRCNLQHNTTLQHCKDAGMRQR